MDKGPQIKERPIGILRATAKIAGILVVFDGDASILTAKRISNHEARFGRVAWGIHDFERTNAWRRQK
jgi:hypothetical protein